jgi:hypothetical protein
MGRMGRNDSNPGAVESRMDETPMSDDGVELEAMAGAGAENGPGTPERGERAAQTTPRPEEGSYGNDSGFAGQGTESERPSPGRTENGGIATDQPPERPEQNRGDHDRGDGDSIGGGDPLRNGGDSAAF